jgi:hypothetical protein
MDLPSPDIESPATEIPEPQSADSDFSPQSNLPQMSET